MFTDCAPERDVFGSLVRFPRSLGLLFPRLLPSSRLLQTRTMGKSATTPPSIVPPRSDHRVSLFPIFEGNVSRTRGRRWIVKENRRGRSCHFFFLGAGRGRCFRCPWRASEGVRTIKPEACVPSVFERGESYDLYIFFDDGSLFNIGRILWMGINFVWTTRIFLYKGG